MLKKYTTDPLQEYTSNGTRFFVVIMPLYVVLLNFIIFGTRFFSSASTFLWGLLITFLILSIVWMVHTWAGLVLKDKLPDEKYYFKQLSIKLCLFVVFKSLALVLLFTTFDKLGYIDGEAEQHRLLWLLLVGNVFNISVTLLHDGSRGLDRWKATLVETEQLRKTHLLGQLMNLKSQMSPQFLFTNLDALSSLMQQSPNAAEAYLDEMSKVYQYFLKANEDTLVTLQCEISFLQSYYHLIKAQHKNLELHIQLNGRADLLLPPFTLQALFEQLVKRINPAVPIPTECTLSLTGDDVLQVRSRWPGSATETEVAHQQPIDHVIRKFSLLTQQTVTVEEGEDYQLILLPLIRKKEGIAV